jgi:hypothetical protein
MSREQRRKVRTLPALLRRHAGQRTVLGIGIPVLTGLIQALRQGVEFIGLTEPEIEAGFRELCGKFIKSDFHSTYIVRRLSPRSFLEFHEGRYRFRRELLDGITLSELEQLHADLIASLRDAYEQRKAAMNRLEAACRLPEENIAERRRLVEEYLSQFMGNRGENFEIISFAVLREYFRSFGFHLQRFSTTHANDGGIDYVGGEAIYQVTVDESAQKLRADMAKAPGVKRVLVRPKILPAIPDNHDENVLETIELSDLLAHFVRWLLERDHRAKRARHLQGILRVALDEFRREEKAEADTSSLDD